MATYFITGTNRGIGLELVKQLAANPANHVIATVREKSKFKAVEDLGFKNVTLIAIDMLASQEEFKEAFAVLKDLKPLDVVIHNAGIVSNDFSNALTHDFSEYSRLMEGNFYPLIKLYRALDPYYAKPLKFIYISTIIASLTDMFAMPNSYGVSKAAGNYVVKQISIERPDDIVVPIHPGGVDTDMTKDFWKLGYTFIPPEESVKGLLKVIAGLKQEDSGKFWCYDGTELAL